MPILYLATYMKFINSLNDANYQYWPNKKKILIDSILYEEIESIINYEPWHNNPDDYTLNIWGINNINHIKILLDKGKEEPLSDSFYKIRLALLLNQDHIKIIHQKEKSKANIPHEHWCKNI
jgi:hypothetical protein